MKSFFTAGRRARLALASVTGAFAFAGPLYAAATPPGAPAQLAPYFTTATRTPADARTLGSAVAAFSAADLARRQLRSFADALGAAAGLPRFASGAPGAATSLFLRGANSNQTLFLVDGLRLNDPNTDYAVFLGGACVSACDSLEVAHGPQSTLHGGEAVGGVVALRAERGAGGPSTRASVEAGSFGTWQGAVAAQGESGASAWNFSTQGGHTDNARPNNAFDSVNTTLRLDRRLGPRAEVGATVRWFHGVYGSPGDRHTNDPDNTEREDNALATVFAVFRPNAEWTSHTILGGQDRRFVAESPRAGGATPVTVVRNRRAVFDSQTTFTGFERHRLTAGLTAEANHTRNTGFGSINRRQGLLALFAQDEWSWNDAVFLTAGLRNDDFDTFGRATTGRVTAAWLAVPDMLKLRASHGTAFRSPSFLDLYGESAFYQGNPALRPERARGWDAGFDWSLASRRGSVSATWFETRYTDLIAGTANFRSVENIQRARTRGVELKAQVLLPAGWEVRLNHTWLDADNRTTGARLLRRPRLMGGGDVLRDFGPRVTLGAGVAHVSGRRDVDARTFAPIDGEDYTVARLHGAWRITPRLTLRARLENVLDEEYEEVNGYPALGFGAFTGLEWTF